MIRSLCWFTFSFFPSISKCISLYRYISSDSAICFLGWKLKLLIFFVKYPVITRWKNKIVWHCMYTVFKCESFLDKARHSKQAKLLLSIIESSLGLIATWAAPINQVKSYEVVKVNCNYYGSLNVNSIKKLKRTFTFPDWKRPHIQRN